MKKILIIGGGAALLLLSILFGVIFAGPLLASANNSQTSSATATTSNTPCDQYLQNLAHRLNVSTSTLQQDSLAAYQDILNQSVKDGKLTQAQADQIQKRLGSKQMCSGKGWAGPTGAMGGHFIQKQLLMKYRTDIVNAVAQGLHLTIDQFKAQLQAGKSLSDIATAQNISATQLHSIVTNAVQIALNKAVSAGDLTQTQANTFTQLMQSHPQFLDRILNGHFGK